MTGISQAPSGDRDEGLGYRWVILAAGILAYGTSQFARQNYTGVQKFIADDLSLDRGTLGLMGSAFFYAYALCQMPWGIASDKVGSRVIIGVGILLTAGTMVGFSTAASGDSLIIWRILSGIAAGAVYVPLTGAIARWFRDSERSFSQGTLAGIGGALGEGMAFFLLPVVAIYFASGWRQGMNMLALVVAVMGVLCLTFLKSAPSGRPATTKNPFDWNMLRDTQLWCYAFLYSGFVVGIRLTQAWIGVYAADVYIADRGMSLNEAVVAGGLLAMLAYSLAGRAVGCPVAGKMSDAFAARGISRTAVLIGWLIVGIVSLQILSMGITSIWAMAIIAALLGTSVNLFSLIPAAISETYGRQRTASLASFTNMVAQLSGATALAVSGYVGISMSNQPGNAVSEYRGIWLSGLIGMGTMTTLGVAAYVALRTGWATRPAVLASGIEPEVAR
jgi:MFS transporter, OPA family, sugar phosphate sensor protein UhpC